jgi:UDP-N-acetylmuramate--alanine ligase
MASDAIKESFVEFANKVKDKSRLFITKELPLEGVTVAVNEDAVYSAVNVRIDGSYILCKTPDGILKDFRFGLPGNII